MFPFPSGMLAGPLGVSFIGSTHQLQASGANTYSMPSGVQVGDILFSIMTHSSLDPTMGGTAVGGGWSTYRATGTGHDLWCFFGTVTNAAGTVTGTVGNANEGVVIAAFRGATSVTGKNNKQEFPGAGTTLTITGFTKNAASRGVLGIVGGYNEGTTPFTVSSPVGMTIIDNYKQTAASPATTSGGTGIGVALAQPADYPDSSSVTFNNTVTQTSMGVNAILLEFT